MESDRFDELTARLARPISRRRGVGLAGALGLSGLSGLSAWQGADARKKKKHKKKHKKKPTTTPPPGCRKTCGGRTCGDDGCGGSCGTCAGELVCRNGTCGCPDGQDLCGGICRAACPPSTPGRVVARHPTSCLCCVRPGSIPCPDSTVQCCLGPADLPCCARACDPLAVHGDCREGFWDDTLGEVCHEDVECYPGSRCPAGNDPRQCALIPG